MKQLLALLIMSLLFVSCTREQEKPAPPPAATEKSLFEELKEQTIKNPNDAEAWYHLADLYERTEQFREEIDALNKVISIKPDKRYTYAKLATAYNRLGQYQDAIRNFNIALKYFPKNPVIYNNLAVAYGKIGKISEEITSLEKAIALRPNYATARFNLGVALLKKGKRGEALKQYEKLKTIDETTAVTLKKEIERTRK